MGNIIYSADIIDIDSDNVSSRSEETGFDDENALWLWDPERAFHADDLTANDWLWKAYFGVSAQAVTGITLVDCNFTHIKVQGNNTDVWTSPTYDGDSIAVSLNPWTNRGHVFIPLAGFTHNYLRLVIPSGTTAQGHYTTKWMFGTIAALSAYTELSTNMSYGYSETAKSFVANGVGTQISTAERLRFECDIMFGNRATTEAAELKTMNQILHGTPFVYYKNDGDTSESYIGVRDDSVEISLNGPNHVTGNSIRFMECYRVGQAGR